MALTQHSIYTIELVNPQGQLLADLSPYLTGRGFTIRRNRAEQIDLSMDLGQARRLCATLGMQFRELFAPGMNEIRIKRVNRYLLGGQISYVRPELTAKSRTVQIQARGFLHLFKDRYLLPTSTLSYINTDIGQIIWNMINESQARTNGSFGITQGVIQASRTMTETCRPTPPP